MFIFNHLSRNVNPSADWLCMFGGTLANENALISSYNTVRCSTLSSTLAQATAGSSTGAKSNIAYVFGGFGGGTGIGFNSIQTFDGDTRGTSSATLETVNDNPAVCSFSPTSDILIFGGRAYGTGFLNKIQRFNGSSRTTDSSVLANATYNMSAAALGSMSYVFGQHVVNYSLLQAYNNVAIVSVGNYVTGGGTGCCAVSTGSECWIFGGSDPGGPSVSNRIQKWNGATWTTTAQTLTDASAVLGAAMLGGKARIFGGTGYAFQNFDGTTKTTEGVYSSSGSDNGCTINFRTSSIQ